MSTVSLFLVALLCFGLVGVESKRKAPSHQPQQPNGVDEFECVDIHKQPAFDHPLLKNHKIQMNPSTNTNFKRTGKSSFGKYSKFGNQIKSCPKGMVPIKRTRLGDEDLNEFRSSAKFRLRASRNIHPLTQLDPGRHVAALRLDGKGVLGTRALISVHNPPVNQNQISTAQIAIQNGEGTELNSIILGWTVNPSLYGDNRTHMSGYWTSDGYHKTGCYDTMCPGFIQVHRRYSLGQYFREVTIPGGKQIQMLPSIFQDGATKHYWLMLNNTTLVGYWPSEIMPKLREEIESITYGGLTFSREEVSPPMGSGLLPDKDYTKSSYFAQMQVMNGKGDYVDVQGGDVFVDNSTCYDLKNWGNLGGTIMVSFTFGGPGGNCGI